MTLAAPRLRGSRAAAPSWFPGLIGIVILLVIWTIIADTVLPERKGLPTPASVVHRAYADGWSFYWPLAKGTAARAIPGFLVGNGVAIVLAMLVILVPSVERVVLQVSVATYCLPIVAVGPILSICLTGNHPMSTLAALLVLFTTLVGTLLGLRSADETSLDLVRAYGGGRWQQLRRVRLTAALPSVMAALKIAAPTSVLGAILGEYLGGANNVGLGYAMIASEQEFAIPRTWALGLTAAALGGVGYAAIGLLTRVVAPWAGSTTA